MILKTPCIFRGYSVICFAFIVGRSTLKIIHTAWIMEEPEGGL